jgi:hypothetical protein
MQFNGQMFYKACVENNSDPQKMGRLQLRVLGLHTPKKVKTATEGIPTSELPWANPAWPITSTAMNDMGTWSIPRQGAWVWCFPEDKELQRWVYFATISGRPVQGPGSGGFNDPDGEYPEIILETDYNRLASNQNIGETIIPIKIAERMKAIPLAEGGTWDEPKEPYDAKYPFNRVFESERKGFVDGHLIEIDDTPGAERIHLWHKKGSWLSVHPNGQMLRRSTHDDYTMIVGDQYNYIDTNQYITIAEDRRVLVMRNVVEETSGTVKIIIGKNKVEDISGDYDLTIGADSPDVVVPPSVPIFDKETVLAEAPKLKEKMVYYEAGKEEQYGIDPIPGGGYSQDINPSFVTDADSKREGSWNISVKKNKQEVIGKNKTLVVDEKRDEIVHGIYYLTITGAKGLGDYIIYVDGDVEKTIDGDYYIDTGGEIYMDAGGQITMRAGNALTIAGCITGNSICPLILAPHVQPSSSVLASY